MQEGRNRPEYMPCNGRFLLIKSSCPQLLFRGRISKKRSGWHTPFSLKPSCAMLYIYVDSSLGIHGNLARGKALPTLTVHYGRKAQASLIEEGRTHPRRCLSPNASDPISQAHYWKTKINMRRGPSERASTAETSSSSQPASYSSDSEAYTDGYHSTASLLAAVAKGLDRRLGLRLAITLGLVSYQAWLSFFPVHSPICLHQPASISAPNPTGSLTTRLDQFPYQLDSLTLPKVESMKFRLPERSDAQKELHMKNGKTLKEGVLVLHECPVEEGLRRRPYRLLEELT
ncbi:hypothetical protein Q3G72_000759 [Acer saccharum]|nr:hypothetical protein Q3G72_028187 [Acer saccharum]KAK1547992.1 hypothetical protein Q3G72_000759 [Acer saccharum]